MQAGAVLGTRGGAPGEHGALLRGGQFAGPKRREGGSSMRGVGLACQDKWGQQKCQWRASMGAPH